MLHFFPPQKKKAFNLSHSHYSVSRIMLLKFVKAQKRQISWFQINKVESYSSWKRQRAGCFKRCMGGSLASKKKLPWSFTFAWELNTNNVIIQTVDQHSIRDQQKGLISGITSISVHSSLQASRFKCCITMGPGADWDSASRLSDATKQK